MHSTNKKILRCTWVFYLLKFHMIMINAHLTLYRNFSSSHKTECSSGPLLPPPPPLPLAPPVDKLITLVIFVLARVRIRAFTTACWRSAPFGPGTGKITSPVRSQQESSGRQPGFGGGGAGLGGGGGTCGEGRPRSRSVASEVRSGSGSGSGLQSML